MADEKSCKNNLIGVIEINPIKIFCIGLIIANDLTRTSLKMAGMLAQPGMKNAFEVWKSKEFLIKK